MKMSGVCVCADVGNIFVIIILTVSTENANEVWVILKTEGGKPARWKEYWMRNGCVHVLREGMGSYKIQNIIYLYKNKRKVRWECAQWTSLPRWERRRSREPRRWRRRLTAPRTHPARCGLRWTPYPPTPSHWADNDRVTCLDVRVPMGEVGWRANTQNE